MTAAARYPANVFWSDEDEGYIAVAPDLPGCSAFGETQSEALSELQDAIVAWIEAARAAGNPVPGPARRAVESQVSGKVLLRMPRSLHSALAQTAKRDHVSLNQYIVYLLTTAHTAQHTVREFVEAQVRKQPHQDMMIHHTRLPPGMVYISGEPVKNTGVRALENLSDFTRWENFASLEARANTAEDAIVIVSQGTAKWQKPRFTFDLSEVAETLIKAQGIHEGAWALGFDIAVSIGTMGSTQVEARPGAMLQIGKVILVRQAGVHPDLAHIVDAAKVNPRSARQKKEDVARVRSGRPKIRASTKPATRKT